MLIYIHKEQMQGAMQKQLMQGRLTTVYPRQGHYALDPAAMAAYLPADLSIEGIGDLLDADTRSLFAPQETR